MTTPDITPAQMVAAIATIAGLLLSQGLITNQWEKTISGIASVVIPLIWIVADAVIRHGRSKVVAAGKAKHIPTTTAAE